MRSKIGDTQITEGHLPVIRVLIVRHIMPHQTNDLAALSTFRVTLRILLLSHLSRSAIMTRDEIPFRSDIWIDGLCPGKGTGSSFHTRTSDRTDGSWREEREISPSAKFVSRVGLIRDCGIGGNLGPTRIGYVSWGSQHQSFERTRWRRGQETLTHFLQSRDRDAV